MNADRVPGPAVLHYLNHAACAPLPQAALDAMQRFMESERQWGGYVAARHAQQAIDAVYERLAGVVGAAAEDIALTQGNTDGWGRIVGAMRWQAGDRVLVARNEWGGNLGILRHLASRGGIELQEIPSDAEGAVDLGALEVLLRQQRVRLVALNWVSTNSPLVQPAEAIGALCARFGAPYLIDAAQAVGQIPVDVGRLRCSALTAPGRKWLRGPRGTGFVYVHPGFAAQLKPPMADHRARPWSEAGEPAYRAGARRLEAAEASMALRLGLGAAVAQWQASGIETIERELCDRARFLRERLSGLSGLRVHTLSSRPMSGIVTLHSDRHPAAYLHEQLQRAGVETAVSPFEFTPLEMRARGLPSVLRISGGHDTTRESLQACVDGLEQLGHPATG
ncbi:aminotransferase class V-fold PLP-dependent enzyme [Paracidovorax anthurii]|uniref:Selenocysteine lyase/cysteine desulfurase n=1 Tax=Paracidovorax anthurii TaxID=78229 RepID=A0A328ZDZ7_9BURK|nr:aminotransferase class V-fold PLP-dependent enzyme [Paracidovorax anthurii]RAR80997.1 selenocysteine lyase/cysteine desulfurase [Paracidovorax anthurii]